MSAYEREVSLDLPCVHRAVRTGRRVVQAFARTDGFEDEEIERLMLVASELLANAVDHGGGGAAMTEDDLESNVRMRLRLVVDGGEWRLEVEDSGGGDEDEARELRALFGAAQPDISNERGRGLFLVSGMVDRLDVRVGKAGLVLIASRRLQQA